jgi:hypothetical protein
MTSPTVAAIASALCLALNIVPHADAAQHSSEQIRIKYAPPKNPPHQQIYNEINKLECSNAYENY